MLKPRCVGIVDLGLLILGALLAYSAFVSVRNGFRLAWQPFQFDYEEGNILNAAVRINAGLTPYPDPHSWPVVLNPYGPIPYLLTARLIRSGEPEFFRPRMVSQVASIAVAIEIAVLVYTCSGNSIPLALFFGAFFLTLPIVQAWSPLLRVDFLGLAFSLAGVLTFLTFHRLRWLAAIPFVLALFCKITLISGPIACAGILLHRRQWRELIIGTLLAASLLFVIIGASQYWTNGSFLFHQFGTHPDPLSWAIYWRNGSQALHETAILIGLTLVGILCSRRLRDPLFYSMTAFLGTFTALKLGGSINHFLEFEAAMCISAAVGIHDLRMRRKLPSAEFVLILLSLLIITKMGIANRATYTTRGVVDECTQAYAYIGEHDQVLSENVGALVLTNKAVLLSNPFVYAQLVRAGKWQSGRIEEMLQNQKADLVMLGKPDMAQLRWSTQALASLSSNYHIARRFVCPDAAVAYEPNSLQRVSQR